MNERQVTKIYTKGKMRYYIDQYINSILTLIIFWVILSFKFDKISYVITGFLISTAFVIIIKTAINPFRWKKIEERYRSIN